MLGKWYRSYKASQARRLAARMPSGTWYQGEIYPTGDDYDWARYEHQAGLVTFNKRYPDIPHKPVPDWKGTLFE